MPSEGFVEIISEADEKDSDDDSFADLDGAEVEELEVLEIKNNNG